jgi:hypothetical protein
MFVAIIGLDCSHATRSLLRIVVAFGRAALVFLAECESALDDTVGTDSANNRRIQLLDNPAIASDRRRMSQGADFLRPDRTRRVGCRRSGDLESYTYVVSAFRGLGVKPDIEVPWIPERPVPGVDNQLEECLRMLPGA